MNYKLISFNIYNEKTNIIYNKNGTPILFYWDCENSIESELYNNEDLKNKIYNIVANDINIYGYLKFNGFIFYEDENDEEQFENITLLVQDIFDLEEPVKGEVLKNKLLCDVLNSLYKDTFNKDYKFDNFLFKTSICELYSNIKKYHQNKFDKQTFLHYIKQDLLKRYMLTNKNSDLIIEYLKNILKDYE